MAIASGLTTSNTGASANATTTSTALILQFPRKASIFRARVSTYGFGSTVSVVGTLSKAPVAQLGLISIGGGLSPEGGGASTNPIAIAAEARTSSKTSVSNATLVRPIATVDGRQIVRLDAIPENEWSYVATSGGITNTTTAVSIAGGAGSGIRNYVTSLQVSSDTLGTATEVVIQDGVAGPILWKLKGTAGTVGIQDIRFHPPLRGATNTLLEAACVTATGTELLNIWTQWDIAKDVLKSACPWHVEKEDYKAQSAPMRVFSGGGDDVIGAFNQRMNLINLLTNYGYKRITKTRLLSPHSKSKLCSFISS